MSWRSEQRFDVAVVGAGPAGLAAATWAAELGANAALLDAAAAPGGQFWRHPAGGSTGDVASLHHDLATYRRLVARLPGGDATSTGRYLSNHHVWAVSREEAGFVVHAVDRAGGNDRPVELRARRLVLAPGAYDRQLPFPGWDLPGVMTAGGVQALLKGNLVVAGPRVVVAGTGPFLLPVAAGLARAGATVAGVHEAAFPRAWLPHLAAVARNPGKLAEAAGYARVLARHRVPVHPRSVVVAAHGEDAVEAVTVARIDRAGRVVPGGRRTVATDVLAVGWGFTPQLELPLALGCRTRVDLDGSLVCVVDEQQRSSVAGVFVAGEACGVGGAALAVVEGTVAGAAAAGSPLPDRGLLRRRTALRRFAAAMHAAHPVPAGWADRLPEDTVVCRCEEVTVGELREASQRYGAKDARSAKLLTRVGMGWCQGRICGYPTGCLLAGWTGGDPTGLPERPVAVPITLGALAADPEPPQ